MLRATVLAVAASFVACALGVIAPGAAQDRARLHFDAGASYYEAGDYEDALREFQRAYQLSDEPKLFYNFHLCHQQLGEYEEAADDLERYLEEVPEVPNRSNLERRLANLRERVQNGAEGVEDDQQEQEPEEVQQVVVQEQPPEDSGISPVAIAGFATAGAGAVMLGIFGGLALGERSELDADPCSATRTCDAGGLRTKAVLADVGLGLLVVGAALGTIFLFLGGDDDGDDEPGEATARWSVSPSVGPDGAAISAQGVF